MPREMETLFEFLNLKIYLEIKQRIKNHSSDFRHLLKSKAVFDDLPSLLFSFPMLKFERGKGIQAEHMSLDKYPVYSLLVCVGSSVSSLCVLLGTCFALSLGWTWSCISLI